MGYLTNEIGIDGMLIAPGYQYSQIDPALTMTRDEHEAKFREIRAAVRKHGYRWLASPIYQDFLTGDRKLAVRAVGLDHAQPVRVEGPCYLLTDGIFPTLRGAAGGHRVGALRPGQRPALRALRDPLRVRAVGRLRRDLQREGDRPEHGVDADGLTFACATGPEERAARRAGLATARGRRRRPRGAAGRASSSRSASPAGWTGCPMRHGDRRDARRRRAGRRALGGRRPRRRRCAGPGRSSPRAASSTIRRSARRCTSGRAPTPSTWRAALLAATGRLPAACGRSATRPRSPLGPLAQAVTPDGRPRPAAAS